MIKRPPPSARTLRARVGELQVFRSFRYRDYRYLWAGGMLWSVGMWLQRVSVSWLVLKSTDSPILVALAFGMYFLPSFFLGPFSGTMADRVNRKKLLVLVHSVSLIASLLLATLVIADAVQVWAVLAIVLFVGTGISFMMPSIQTLVYDIVGPRDAQNGLALLPAAFKLVGIVGAVLGGILIETVGMATAFLVGAATHGVGVLILSLMHYTSGNKTAVSDSVLANLVEGFKFFARTPALMWVMGMTMIVEGLGYGSLGLLPIFADDEVLDVGASGLGVMNGAIAFGGMFGALTLAARGEIRSKGRLLLAVFLLYGLFIGGFSQSNVFVLSLALLTCWGVVQGVYNTTGVLLMQRHVPNEMRGRAMGIWAISIGMDPFGALILGSLTTYIGVQNAVGVAGALILVSAIAVTASVPQVRTLS